MIPRRSQSLGVRPQLPHSSVPRLVMLKALLITAITFWIYSPALHGPWLWDDGLLVWQNALIRDPAGIFKIWFQPSQLVDYFPLTTSVQWIEWHLFGDNTLGYHLVNVVLHVIGALLVWRLLAKLGLRLAWLGGLLFAIHPMAVESVAWISELKNTLSLPPFLLAMCAWVDFDRNTRRGDYLRALGFFLVAMLCKPTMVMFPVVILLYSWWRRQRVGVMDMAVSAPFFAVSLVIGLVNLAYVHSTTCGNAVDIGGPLVRLALAGQVLAFYVAKCIWPSGLMPVYPMWHPNPSSPGEWLPWVILFGALAACWIKRATWGRHALLGLGFFLINLAPFLGLTQGAYMYFTWVMDHVAYIPLIGLIGLFVAAMQRLDGILFGPLRVVGMVTVGVLVIILTTGSRASAGLFGNPLALWTYAANANPNSWTVRVSYGEALAQKGRIDEAMTQFEEAKKIAPTHLEARFDLGKAYVQLNRLPEAQAEYEAILKLDPKDTNAAYSLGNVLLRGRHVPEAARLYEWTLQIDPHHGPAHYALGGIYLGTDRIPEAIDQLQQAARLIPDRAEVHSALGNAYHQAKRLPEALDQFKQAAHLQPDSALAHCDLGVAFAQTGQIPEAAQEFQAALQLDPNYVDAHYDLGNIFLMTGKIPEAIEQFHASLQINPGFAPAQQALARAEALNKAGTPPASP